MYKKKEKNMVKEKNKQELINFIDNLKETFFEKLYKSQQVQLNNLRNKYVYKDISVSELIEDVKYLKKVDEDIKWSYYWK
jgi:hypothetical protein